MCEVKKRIKNVSAVYIFSNVNDLRKGNSMPQTYTYEEVLKACLEYFEGDQVAAKSAVTKYLLKDKEENWIEKTPNDYLARRLPQEFNRIEKKYPNPLSLEEIREALGGILDEDLKKNPELKKKLRYGPIVCQGSPTFGIGNYEKIISLANCFCLGAPLDSYSSICMKDQEIAQVQKRRGGTGLDLSNLRPRGTVVNNAAITSDGISVFLERFSNTTKEVAQSGRRGACLVSLDCRHPEILNFINIKRDKKKVNGANISVKWHDDFFEALIKNGKYILRFPVDASPEKSQIIKEVNAKDIWDAFVLSAWESAEPGCFYWDRMIGQSITDVYAEEGFRTISTNPCGEQPLGEYGSCILMLLNLISFIDNPFCPDSNFNWDRFDKYSKLGIRLIDDLVDLEIEKVKRIIQKVESDPEPNFVKSIELNLWKKILETNEKGRKTGLGVTGLADMLAYLNIKYSSQEAIDFCDKLFSRLQNNAYTESSLLAKERGPFACWNWEKEKDNYYIKKLPKETQDLIKKYGRRNIANLTLSPAGTASIMTQTTSGIEPLYRHEMIRRRKMTQDEEKSGSHPDSIDLDGIKWINDKVYHKGFSLWQQVTGKDCFCDSPYSGSEAYELDPMFRVKMQGVIQSHIESSISSTLNLPKTTTKEQVSELYIAAHKSKCKGLTIYRDGSREGVLLTGTERPSSIMDSQAPARTEFLPCEIHLSTIKGNKWIFLIGLMNDKPYEVFGGKLENIDIPKKFIKGREKTDAIIRKNGKNSSGVSTYDLLLGSTSTTHPLEIKDIASMFSPDNGTPTRLISMLLRHGVNLHSICEQIRKIPQEDSMMTFEKGISRVLRKYVADKTKAKGVCPECQSALIYEGGCVKCSQCSWSRCD